MFSVTEKFDGGAATVGHSPSADPQLRQMQAAAADPTHQKERVLSGKSEPTRKPLWVFFFFPLDEMGTRSTWHFLRLC